MKHKYKIKVREKDLTDEQIARHMDFSKVMGQYQKYTTPLTRKPLYKNPKAFLGLSLVAVTSWLVYEAVKEEENMPPSPAQVVVTDTPPAPNPVNTLPYAPPPVTSESAATPAKPITANLPRGRQLHVPAANASGYCDYTAPADPLDGALMLLAEGIPAPAGVEPILRLYTGDPAATPATLTLPDRPGPLPQLLRFDPEQKTWIAIPGAISRISPTDDGFTMRELAGGTALDSAAPARKLRVKLSGNGTYALSTPQDHALLNVRLQDAQGQPLAPAQLAVLEQGQEWTQLINATSGSYAIPEGGTAARMAWGLLPGGKVAILRAQALSTARNGATLTAEIAPAADYTSLRALLHW